MPIICIPTCKWFVPHNAHHQAHRKGANPPTIVFGTHHLINNQWYIWNFIHESPNLNSLSRCRATLQQPLLYSAIVPPCWAQFLCRPCRSTSGGFYWPRCLTHIVCMTLGKAHIPPSKTSCFSTKINGHVDNSLEPWGLGAPSTFRLA
jgi:hypothetical protein